eukprot:g8563.t1
MEKEEKDSLPQAHLFYQEEVDALYLSAHLFDHHVVNTGGKSKGNTTANPHEFDTHLHQLEGLCLGVFFKLFPEANLETPEEVVRQIIINAPESIETKGATPSQKSGGLGSKALVLKKALGLEKTHPFQEVLLQRLVNPVDAQVLGTFLPLWFFLNERWGDGGSHQVAAYSALGLDNSSTSALSNPVFRIVTGKLWRTLEDQRLESDLTEQDLARFRNEVKRGTVRQFTPMQKASAWKWLDQYGGKKWTPYQAAANGAFGPKNEEVESEESESEENSTSPKESSSSPRGDSQEQKDLENALRASREQAQGKEQPSPKDGTTTPPVVESKDETDSSASNTPIEEEQTEDAERRLQLSQDEELARRLQQEEEAAAAAQRRQQQTQSSPARSSSPYSRQYYQQRKQRELLTTQARLAMVQRAKSQKG